MEEAEEYRCGSVSGRGFDIVAVDSCYQLYLLLSRIVMLLAGFRPFCDFDGSRGWRDDGQERGALEGMGGRGVE